MKKTWFDVRLYVDGIKQLKLMGILFTVLTTLVVLIPPIMTQLDYLSRVNRLDYVPSPETMSALNMNPLIILLFCLFAPLMTLYLFSFLTKRESSDYYHAIPATRPCLFFSFFAAVMTWVAVISVISNVAAVVIYSCFPHLYLVNYGSVALTAFTSFAGAWLIGSCVAIATSVSGTVVVNLLVSLILIFFPRILILLTVTSIQSTFPLVDGVDFVPILSAEYNVPVGFIFGIFDSSLSASLTKWQSGVYTMVIALLYTVAAVWLFSRRRSEAAGHSAPSKKLQGFFRFLVGFVISSVATFGMYTMLLDRYTSWDITDIASVFLVYGFAVLAFLIFEVFCTRKFRGLIRKGAVTLLFLVIANVTLLCGMYGIGKSLHLFSPDADDIQSVRLVSGLEGGSYYSRYTDYFSAQVAQLELKDPEIKKTVARQLKYTLGLLETSSERYYNEMSNANSVTVAIDTGFMTHYRHIYLYNKDIEELTDYLYEQPIYRQAYATLPESVSSIDFDSERRMWFHYDSNAELKNLYDTFKAEYSALDFKTQFALVSDTYSDDLPLCHLYMRISKGGKWYNCRLPLYQELMPRTAKLVVNYANQSSNAQEGLAALAKDAYHLSWLQVQYFKDGTISEPLSISFTGKPELLAQAAEYLKQLQENYATNNIDTDKPFLYLCGGLVRRENYGDGKGDYTFTEENYCFVAIPDTGLPPWLEEVLSEGYNALA